MTTISGFWGDKGVYKSEADSLASLSDNEFQKKYEFTKKGNDRLKSMRILQGAIYDDDDDDDGGNGSGNGSGNGNGNGNGNGSGSGNGNGNSSSFGSSLFGGGSLDTDFDKVIGVSKDMAKFRLGLDQEQGRFSRQLREEESQSNFGRDTQLKAQDIKGQQELQGLIENASTDRTQRTLSSEEKRQKADFDQQNLFRANSAALAMRGLR